MNTNGAAAPRRWALPAIYDNGGILWHVVCPSSLGVGADCHRQQSDHHSPSWCAGRDPLIENNWCGSPVNGAMAFSLWKSLTSKLFGLPSGVGTAVTRWITTGPRWCAELGLRVVLCPAHIQRCPRSSSASWVLRRGLRTRRRVWLAHFAETRSRSCTTQSKIPQTEVEPIELFTSELIGCCLDVAVQHRQRAPAGVGHQPGFAAALRVDASPA